MAENIKGTSVHKPKFDTFNQGEYVGMTKMEMIEMYDTHFIAENQEVIENMRLEINYLNAQLEIFKHIYNP